MAGIFKCYQATSRVKVANYGATFPETDSIIAHALMVTAAESNAGTVYIRFQATRPYLGSAAAREQKCIPLTKGQSVSFTAPTTGAGNQRALYFGNTSSWVLGSATSQRIICTYVGEK